VSGGHPPRPHRAGIRLLAYLLVCWAANAVVLAIVCWIFDDIQAGTNAQLLTAAAVFGVLNTIVKPILRLFTFPLAVFTLGLAWFAVSMLMLWLTSVLVSGFDVNGFWTYVWATIVIWLLNVAVDLVMWRGRAAAAGAGQSVALSG
jgi:putative membrane protein